MADYRMGCFLAVIRKEAADLFCSSRSLFGDWCVFFLPTLAIENYSSGKKEAGRAGRQAWHVIYAYLRYLADTYTPCPPK